jgi:hypothetical protein
MVVDDDGGMATAMVDGSTGRNRISINLAIRVVEMGAVRGVVGGLESCGWMDWLGGSCRLGGDFWSPPTTT